MQHWHTTWNWTRQKKISANQYHQFTTWTITISVEQFKQHTCINYQGNYGTTAKRLKKYERKRSTVQKNNRGIRNKETDYLKISGSIDRE